MQTDTDMTPVKRELDIHRQGRGGDRGGRRPIIINGGTEPFYGKLSRVHLEWVRERVGRGRGGSGRVTQFIRMLMEAAVGMGLSFDDWQKIARSPARFAAALREEIQRSD